MLAKTIKIESPWVIKVVEEDIFNDKLNWNDIIVKTLYTTVSVGTELYCIDGVEGWFPLPNIPGYSAVGKIVKLGSKDAPFKVGEIIAFEGKHREYNVAWTNWNTVRVPQGTDLKYVPLLRLAGISFTAIRNSKIEIGDFVGVSGAGLIGNFAAQLAGIQGATVIGIDFAENRLNTLKACGIEHVIDPSKENVEERIKEITGGKGIDTFIEATGVPKAAEQYIKFVKVGGEMILLGSFRDKYETNITPLLNAVHLHNTNVTLKGAHEGSLPVLPAEYVKHSKVRNIEVLLRLLKNGKLKVEPLNIKLAKPEEMPVIYKELKDNRDKYTGVIIDWSDEKVKAGTKK